MQQQKAIIGYFLLILLIVTLDQGFKLVLPPYQTVFRNSGIVLGLFPQAGFYFAILGLGLLALVLFRNHLNSASAILLGGAISNLVDRLRFGYVVDYIDLKAFPVFNLADVAIILGSLMLLVEIFRKKDKSYG